MAVIQFITWWQYIQTQNSLALNAPSRTQRLSRKASMDDPFGSSSVPGVTECLAMQASMLEIYNEEYKDLLGKGPPAGKKHQVCLFLFCPLLLT